MGWFSGSSANIPLPEPLPAGIQTDRLPTSERGRPVPVFYGKQRLGVIFLSQAFDQSNEDVEQDVGKEDVTVGYNYFASFAALVCHGPVDRIHAIYFDDALVWEEDPDNPTDRSTNPTFVNLTIEDYCNSWTLYWGTDSQDIDSLLASLDPSVVVSPNVAEEHSAYRGQCYFVANHQLLGYGKTNVQIVELVVSRYPTVSWWPVDLPVEINGDCNPIACIADLLQNQRYGLGLNDERIDIPGLVAAARQIHSDGIGISPIITETTPVRRLLIELLEYVDAYHYTTADGKFSIGLARPISLGASIPELDERHLSERPTLSSSGWDSTFNRVYVNYVNRWNHYLDDSVSADNASACEALGEVAAQVLERPWITRPEVAEFTARHSATWLGQPTITGSFKLRSSTLDSLALDVGSAFKLSWMHLHLNRLYCRVTELRVADTKVPEVEVQFSSERTRIDGDLYVIPTYVPPVEGSLVAVDTSHIRIFELPYLAELGDEPAVAFLVARRSRTTDRFRVHRKRDDDSYIREQKFRYFSLRARLNGQITASATSLTLDVVNDATDTTLPTSISAAEADADKYVLLLVDEAGNQEIVSISACALVSGRRWSCTVARHRFDTVALAWPDQSDVWFINAYRANGYTRRLSKPRDLGTVATFKLQVGTKKEYIPLEDVTPIAITLTRRVDRPWSPYNLSVTPTSISAWQTVSVTWSARLKDNASVPKFPGVYWIVQVKAATDTTWINAISGLPYTTTSYDITSAKLTDKLGSTPVSFDVRVIAMSGSMESLFNSVTRVTKV